MNISCVPPPPIGDKCNGAIIFNENPFHEKNISLNTISDFYDMHHNILWEDGFHKYCVGLFIQEMDRLLGRQGFDDFPQERLDYLVGALRRQGNSNATINRKCAALRKLLRKAHRMGQLKSLPEFTRLKERTGRIRFLEYEEEDALFSAIRSRSEDYYRLAVFLVDTGARLGEAIGLRWNDVGGGQVTFWITKSGRSRSIPLTGRAQRMLRAAGSAGGGPFLHVRQPRFRAAWHAARKECGLGHDSDVVPHILRHTCASRLVRGGIDLRRVQVWLGHQTLQMTMRYAHLATRDLEACLPVLERQRGDRPRPEAA